ncbi:DNA repair protein RecO C-terminal domain-containing protein [Aquifex pyrophilus]
MKGEFIVLRRVRGGDVDLVATLYGTHGKLTLFLKEGYLNENPLFGVFEPFNWVEIDFQQAGNIIIPNDVRRIKRLSYKARDYEQFLYMSKISEIVLWFVHSYDEKIYGLLLRELGKKVKNVNASVLRFYINLIELLGYTPKFLYEGKVRKRVRINLENGEIGKGNYEIKGSYIELLRKIKNMEDYERIKITRGSFREIEKFLKDFLSFHTK